MANVVYNSAKAELFKGSIDCLNDTLKVALVTSSYIPSASSHTYYSDITNEVSGTGYTAGGATLTNVSVSKDDIDAEGVLDADDVTWSSSTITARGAVIYKDSGVASTSPLICYIDFGSDKASSASNFVLQWNSEGIININ